MFKVGDKVFDKRSPDYFNNVEVLEVGFGCHAGRLHLKFNDGSRGWHNAENFEVAQPYLIYIHSSQTVIKYGEKEAMDFAENFAAKNPDTTITVYKQFKSCVLPKSGVQWTDL